MSLTSFVVWKHWASNRLRTALTLLGIALGVAIVVAIFVMDHNTIQTRFLQQSLERGPVDLEAMPVEGRATAEVLADLRARPKVEAATVWREGKAMLRSKTGSVDAELLGIEPGNASSFDHYAMESGADLQPSDEGNAILLGAEAARLLGVAPGDRIAIEEAARSVRYECRDGQLVALPEPARELARVEVAVKGIVAPLRMGRRNFGQVAVAPIGIARNFPSPAPERFQIRRVYGADLDRLRNELTSAGYVVADERAAQLGEGADERAFRNGIKILGCLALLLGMFVVFQTLSHSLVARVRMLGLLRCIGASRGAVGRIFLFDALLLGIVGSALGVMLGVLLAAMLRSAEISSLGGAKEWLVFELPIAPIVGTFALGVVFTLAGAAFPLWRARQLPALWILRQQGTDQGGDADLLAGVNRWLFLLLVLVLPAAYLAMTPLVSEEGRETLFVLLEMAGMLAAVGGLLLIAPFAVALFGRVLLLPLSLFAPLSAWLCGKSIARQSGRIAASTVGIAAVLLAFLGLETITASLQGDVRLFSASALQGRAFAEVSHRTVEECAKWRDIPGVDEVVPIQGEIHGPFLLRGLDAKHAARAGGALEGEQDKLRRYVDEKARTIICSRRLALEMGWREGSLVSLRDRNQTPVSYEVLHVSDKSGYAPSEQAWAIASPHWLQRDFCVAGAIVQYVTLQLSPGADADVVGARLRDRVPDLIRYKTGNYVTGYHLHDVERDFRLFEVLLLLILVLAATGLLNGMTIAALARARELGVLRALGVGASSLKQSLLFEGLVIGGLGSLLAVLLCVPMAQLLISGLNRIAALDAPVVLPLLWMTLAPVVGLVVGVIAAWIPAHRAAAQDPASSVRYE